MNIYTPRFLSRIFSYIICWKIFGPRNLVEFRIHVSLLRRDIFIKSRVYGPGEYGGKGGEGGSEERVEQGGDTGKGETAEGIHKRGGGLRE